jgi:hypothetical protein
MSFSSNAAIPVDDPAIQFFWGGREVEVFVPANTVRALFPGFAAPWEPLMFQAGTVAGTLTFNGAVQTGAVQTTFSTVKTIPRQAPAINAVRLDGSTVVITLMSALREVTQLRLRFETTPAVRLNCGTGCSVSGNELTFDVKPLFDAWYGGDSVFGSLSNLRLPLSIQGAVSGTVFVTLGNSLALSNSMSFPLP